jgi:phytoene desaturase
MQNNQKKTLAVIGGGFGGLALAIRAQAAGVQTTILEKRDMLGGRGYVYRDGGFTFDAGPTVITAPECIEELFTVAGKKMSDYVDLIPVMPFYRLFFEDGYVFDYSNDEKSIFNQIKSKSPNDEAGYRAFLKYTQEVFNEGYTKLAHVPFLDWSSMIRVSPQLIKLQAFRSVYSMVSKYIKDPQLRQVFSFHSLLVGGNPFSTSSIYTLIHYLERNWGVYFARGGTGALVKALERLFVELGGQVRLNTTVKKIATSNGAVSGVVLQDGQLLNFDNVASNGDVRFTYNELLKDEPRLEGARKSINKKSLSMSLFVIYFGTKVRYPNMAHHNVIFGGRYKEHLADIFKRGTLADDFSLYLHAPTVSDASLAPPGHEAFYVLSPVPHLGAAPIDWTVEGPKYADKIMSYLEARYLPNLRANVVTQRIFTPNDFQTEL